MAAHTTKDLKRREFLSTSSGLLGVLLLAPWLENCVADVGQGGRDEGSSGGGDELTDGTNDAWEQRTAQLETPTVYNKGTPWSDGTAKAGTHVPKPSLSERKLAVEVPHPMLREHYITLIYLRDQDDVVVGYYEIEQPAEGSMEMGVTHTFDIPEGVTSVTAYAHCNLHDVWKSDELTMG